MVLRAFIIIHTFISTGYYYNNNLGEIIIIMPMAPYFIDKGERNALYKIDKNLLFKSK